MSDPQQLRSVLSPLRPPAAMTGPGLGAGQQSFGEISFGHPPQLHGSNTRSTGVLKLEISPFVEAEHDSCPERSFATDTDDSPPNCDLIE